MSVWAVLAVIFSAGFVASMVTAARGRSTKFVGVLAGLLAVAAACCAERAAPPVQRYLKEWYGTRAAQGKALNDHASRDVKVLASALAPLASSSGTTPRVKASDVMRMGRRRSRFASKMASSLGFPCFRR